MNLYKKDAINHIYILANPIKYIINLNKRICANFTKPLFNNIIATYELIMQISIIAGVKACLVCIPHFVIPVFEFHFVLWEDI